MKILLDWYLDVKDYNGRVLDCPARVSIINGIGKIETVSRGLVFQFEEEVCTLYLFASVANFSGKESER